MQIFPKFMHKTIFAALIGTSLVGSGILLIILRIWILETTISFVFVLSPRSFVVNYWLKPINRVYTDFYFFNWTNPHRVYNGTEKLEFHEIGPYRFRETSEKVNVTWNSNDTVTYRQLKYWYFVENESAGKLTDWITTIDSVLLNAAYQFNEWNTFTKKEFSLSLLTSSSHLHINRTIDQLLFEGYRDSYVDLAEALPFLDHTLPPLDKIGWFTSRNGSYTYEGTFNIDTGSNLGELLQLNYKKSTSHQQKSCGNVYGSASDFYSKNNTQKSIDYFATDLCRNVRLDYAKDASIRNIGGRKYTAQSSLLDNGTTVAENKCYCNGECIPSGVLNISSCRYGMPFFASQPHFFGADPVYLDQIEGLRPDKSKHELFLTIEPNTGTVLQERLRLQLNVRLRPVRNITIIDQVPTVMVPMFWFERKYELPDEVTTLMKFLLKIPIICTVLAVIDMIMGVFLLMYARHRYKSRRKSFRGKSRQKKYGNFEEVPLHEDMESPYMSTTIGHDYLEVIHDDEYDD